MFKQTVATLALFAALTTPAFAQSITDDPPAPGGSAQADLATTVGRIDVAAMKVYFTVTNRGTSAAQSCRTQIVIMAGSILGGAQLNSAVLAPGQSAEVSYPLPVKALLAHLAGKQVNVSIKVDYCNSVSEFDEDNNSLDLVW